jgi:hypothetical protein
MTKLLLKKVKRSPCGVRKKKKTGGGPRPNPPRTTKTALVQRDRSCFVGRRKRKTGEEEKQTSGAVAARIRG